MSKAYKIILVVTAIAASSLSACSSSGIGDGADSEKSLEEAQQADFRSALSQDENRLVRPPNVISETDKALLRIDEGNQSRLLPTVAQARLKREGSSFWLEVDLPAETVWTVVRDFWLSEGFEIESEIPESGVVETDWQQDRSRVLGIGLSQYLDAFFERVNDTGERYKFRSRIERVDGSDSTLVFISYRAVQEVRTAVRTGFDILPNNPTLEAEMLRRLMLYFRSPEESIATLEDFQSISEDDILFERRQGSLLVLRDQEQTWRLLLLALDRGGFKLVDTDKEAGSVTIVTADPTLDETELGFFDTLFGGQEDGEPFEAVIAISSAGDDRTEVTVPEGELGESIIEILIANI